LLWSAERTRSIPKLITAALLALVFAVVPLSFSPASIAQAATPPPDILNVLPSTVIGSRAAVLSKPEALAVLIAKYAKDPQFWIDVKTSTAARTAAQSANVAAEAAKFAVPVTKAAPMLKVVAGANVPVAGLSMGMMAGNAAARMFGFNDSQVCAENNGVLEAVSFVTNGVSCKAYDNQLAQAQRNLDASVTLNPISLCVPGGKCWNIVALRAVAGSSPAQESMCINKTGSGPDGTSIDARLRSGTQSIGGNGYNSPYPCEGLGLVFANQGEFRAPAADPVVSMKLQYGTGQYTAPVEVVRTPGNPTRQYKCTAVTLQGTFTRTSDAFTENDPVWKPVLCPVVPSGQVTQSLKIEQMGGPQPLTLLDTPSTPEYKSFRATYPGCDTGACPLELKKNGVTCFTAGTLCADWFTDPNKATDYQCTYGGIAAPLEECNVYAPSFKEGAVSTGTAYGDPVTGDAPTAQPTSVPADVKAFGTPTQDPNAGRQCLPSGWGVFNPIEWIMKPAQCALEWAFVPRDSVMKSAAGRASVGWARTPMGQVPAVVAVFSTLAPSSSGCSGPLVEIGALGINYSGYPMSACAQPVAGVATTIRTIGAAIMLWYAALAVIRYISGVVAYQRLGEGVSDA